MSCTCKKSEHLDQDWKPFLNMDINCPKHSSPTSPVQCTQVITKEPKKEKWPPFEHVPPLKFLHLDNQAAKLIQQLSEI